MNFIHLPKLRVLAAVACISLSHCLGCVSNERINKGFRDIDNAWATELQERQAKLSATFNAPRRQVTLATTSALRSLGMKILESNEHDGIVVAKSEAPKPLTKQEWRAIADAEKNRVKEVGGWMFTVPRNPSGYFITVIARLQQLGSATAVALEYRLEMPRYEQYGLEPSRNVPPDAAILGSERIFNEIGRQLNQ